MAVVCGEGCTRRTFDPPLLAEVAGAGGATAGGEGMPRPKLEPLPLRLCARCARLWKRPKGAPAAAAAVSSFLKLSAAAKRCGSMMRQPTLLAFPDVLQLGVSGAVGVVGSGSPAAAAAALSVASGNAGRPLMPMGRLANVASAAAFAEATAAAAETFPGGIPRGRA